MKLTDYIFGSRRGREANRLEREAMADPFLADAVEGYDSVYGGHSDKLAELEQEVARRAVRPRRRAGRRRIVPLIRGAVAVAAVVAVAVVWYLRRPSSEVPSEEIAQAVRSFGLPAENLTEPAGDFAVPAEGFAEPSEGFWVEPADGQAEPAADFAAADEEAAPAVAETMRPRCVPGGRGDRPRGGIGAGGGRCGESGCGVTAERCRPFGRDGESSRRYGCRGAECVGAAERYGTCGMGR